MTVSDKTLDSVVKVASSYRDVCRRLGVSVLGGRYRHIRGRIIALNLSTEHFTPFARRGNMNTKMSLEEVLVENSTYLTSRLKRRLVSEGFMKDRCVECGVGSIWNGKSITLHLDHIDGVSDNHQIDNLRILCPNCHSQTDTYCGKNNGRASRLATAPVLKTDEPE